MSSKSNLTGAERKRKPKFRAGQVVMVKTEAGDSYPVKLRKITFIGCREEVAWMDSLNNVEYQSEMRHLTKREKGGR